MQNFISLKHKKIIFSVYFSTFLEAEVGKRKICQKIRKLI